jgi:hypothetical protein
VSAGSPKWAPKEAALLAYEQVKPHGGVVCKTVGLTRRGFSRGRVDGFQACACLLVTSGPATHGMGSQLGREPSSSRVGVGSVARLGKLI